MRYVQQVLGPIVRAETVQHLEHAEPDDKLDDRRGSRVRVDSRTVSSRAAGLGEIARARAIAARPFGSREETSPWPDA